MPGQLYSDHYAALVALLKGVREEAGVTQAELARRVGQPQSFISKNERRERRVDVIEFIEIARALDLDASDLLGRVEAIMGPHIASSAE